MPHIHAIVDGGVGGRHGDRNYISLIREPTHRESFKEVGGGETGFEGVSGGDAYVVADFKHLKPLGEEPLPYVAVGDEGVAGWTLAPGGRGDAGAE